MQFKLFCTYDAIGGNKKLPSENQSDGSKNSI